MEKVIVFKDKKSREIHTYIHLGGHGARVDLSHFIDLIAEAYGSPATTLTIEGHKKRLMHAMEAVILHMKSQTREVAAENLEPEAKG